MGDLSTNTATTSSWMPDTIKSTLPNNSIRVTIFPICIFLLKPQAISCMALVTPSTAPSTAVEFVSSLVFHILNMCVLRANLNDTYITAKPILLLHVSWQEWASLMAILIGCKCPMRRVSLAVAPQPCVLGICGVSGRDVIPLPTATYWNAQAI